MNNTDAVFLEKYSPTAAIAMAWAIADAYARRKYLWPGYSGWFVLYVWTL